MKCGHFHLGPHLPEQNLQITVIEWDFPGQKHYITLWSDRTKPTCLQTSLNTQREQIITCVHGFHGQQWWISLVVGKAEKWILFFGWEVSSVVDCSYMQDLYSMVVKVVLMTLTCRAESRVNMINLAARTILARATSQPAFWAWSNSLSSLLLLTWWVPLHWTRRISVSEQNSFLDQGLNFYNPWRSTNSYHTILFSCFNLVCTLQQQLAHLRQKVGAWKAPRKKQRKQ